jgi:hypothetical protein
MQRLGNCFLALMLMLASSTLKLEAASFQAIGVPPCVRMSVYGVSANSVVVGGGGWDGDINWIWSAGVYSTVSDVHVGIRNISDDGSVMIAGDTYLKLGNPIYKIVNGATQVIPGFAQNTQTIVYSLSEDGSKIVGGTRSEVPWVYQNDSYTSLPLPAGYTYGRARAISSDGSVIAGGISGASVNNPVLWTNSGIEILPNPLSMAYSGVSEISGDGSTVVGGSYNDFAAQQPTLWRNGAVETLPMLPGVTSSVATAVSFDGSLIFGNLLDASDDNIGAFVWDEINSTRLLKDFLEDDYGLNLTGWNLLSVSATDASGNIITGYGINPQGQSELWIATIPEPMTITLFALGALMLRRVRIH